MKQDKGIFDIENGEVILIGKKKFRLIEKVDRGSYFNILIEAVDKGEAHIIRKVPEFTTFTVVSR